MPPRKGRRIYFADALENGQLTRRRMLNDGTMVRVSVIEEWKPSDLGVPELDSRLPDFTNSSEVGDLTEVICQRDAVLVKLLKLKSEQNGLR